MLDNRKPERATSVALVSVHRQNISTELVIDHTERNNVPEIKHSIGCFYIIDSARDSGDNRTKITKTETICFSLTKITDL